MLKKETSTEVVNKMTELRFGMQHERMANANIVTLWVCRDCEGQEWFDCPNCYVCVVCAKAHGKSSFEMENWKPKQKLGDT